MLQPMDKARAVKRSTLFEEIPLEDITRFMAIFAEEVFPEGHIIFNEGDPGEVMYIIVSGEVLIEKKVEPGMEMKITLGPNECFGEMAILDGLPRSAKVKVTREGTFLTIAREDFREMLRVYPEIAFKVISMLSTRLRNVAPNITKTMREQL
jgi:CRP/FNR family transcriptional regulator, cyclic AMP receptor protein